MWALIINAAIWMAIFVIHFIISCSEQRQRKKQEDKRKRLEEMYDRDTLQWLHEQNKI